MKNIEKSIKYGSIEVFYNQKLDGGGTGFGQDFIPVVRKRFGKVNRVFEFCSGPGFIGFSLLGNNLCNSLCLADINPQAIGMCDKTIEKNNLNNRVSTYCSDVFENIPKTEKWDLVVGNPPHFNKNLENILLDDPNWNIHKRFYKNVKKFLNTNASVLLQEHVKGSSENDFKDMIRAGGLAFIESFKYHRPAHIEFSEAARIGFSKKSSVKRIPSFICQKIRERIDYPFYFIHSKNIIE